MFFLKKLDSDYFILISKFWLGAEFTDPYGIFQWFQKMSQNLLIQKQNLMIQKPVWTSLILAAEFPVGIFWSFFKISNF